MISSFYCHMNDFHKKKVDLLFDMVIGNFFLFFPLRIDLVHDLCSIFK
jgi:hypothetical protein